MVTANTRSMKGLMKPITQQPDYIRLAKEISDLVIAQSKVHSRIAEVELLLRTAAPDDGATHVDAALKFAATGITVIPGNVPAELREEHLILRQQREAVDNALRSLRTEMQSLVGELSRKVCVELEGKHKALCGRYLEALKSLDAIAMEEREMFAQLGADGYSVNFREYVAWPYLGLLRVPGDPIASKARELSRYAD